MERFSSWAHVSCLLQMALAETAPKQQQPLPSPSSHLTLQWLPMSVLLSCVLFLLLLLLLLLDLEPLLMK